MLGSSRTSLAIVREAVTGAYEQDGLTQAGSDLLAITDLVGRERVLRAALGDSGSPAGERRAILGRLLADRVSPLALSLAETVVSQRWSSDVDMVDALEIAGALALFSDAEKAGSLERTEEELFRFNRIAAGNDRLQLTISDPALPSQAKRAIVTDLLQDKATDTTITLVAFLATHLRGRRFEAALDGMCELAAERRGRLVAVVTSAIALTEEQLSRLESVLGRIYSRPVELNTVIDPAVIGGVSVQVGDEIIDGTIASRLADARRRMVG